MTISVRIAIAITTDNISIRPEIAFKSTPAIKHRIIKIIPRVSFLNLIANKRKKAMKMIIIHVSKLILNRNLEG